MSPTRRRNVLDEDPIPEWFSDVPISSSVVIPDDEIAAFGGFSWTGNGIMPSLATVDTNFLSNLDWVNVGEHFVPDETDTA